MDCYFKIDTGSDVSIVNKRFVQGGGKLLPVKNHNLRYPTGEMVRIENKILSKIELGKYSVEIPLLIAEISDDCLLGVDFLKKINLENIFDSVFTSSESRQRVAECACTRQIPKLKVSENRCEGEVSDRVPTKLKELFADNTPHLNTIQKEVLVNFLNEFRDVFSVDIVAGNCDMVKHCINVKDCPPPPLNRYPVESQSTYVRKLQI